MRYGTTIMAVAALGAFVAAAPIATRAESTKDKVENKMEQVKEKAKSTAEEATTAVKDSWITAKTKIALFADERVKGREVHVDTKNGVIDLQGTVETRDAKQAASEIAKGIDGARSVKNDLRVVPPTAPMATATDGEQLAKTVDSRLSKDPELAKVEARASDAGVVTLTGEVPTITASAKASESARAVPGVKAVKNELTVLQAR